MLVSKHLGARLRREISVELELDRSVSHLLRGQREIGSVGMLGKRCANGLLPALGADFTDTIDAFSVTRNRRTNAARKVNGEKIKSDARDYWR